MWSQLSEEIAMTEPFDAVLAELRSIDMMVTNTIATRLAAAHAAEVGEWKRVAAAQAELHDESERRAEAAERDAGEVVGLLDEAWGHVPSGSLADRIHCALKGRAAIATTGQADED